MLRIGDDRGVSLLRCRDDRGDELGRDGALRVVGDDERVCRRRRFDHGLDEARARRRARLGARLLIDPHDLLAARDEPRLVRRRPCRIGDEAGDDPALREHLLDDRGAAVLAHDPDQGGPSAEGGDVRRRVRRAAERVRPARDLEDGDRRLG
jgi:hypothetical protein